MELRRRVSDVVTQCERLALASEAEREIRADLAKKNEAELETLREELHRLERTIRDTVNQCEDKSERMLREFTRTIDQLTENEELLRGVRALVRLVQAS